MMDAGVFWPFNENVHSQIRKLGSRLDFSNATYTAILIALQSVLWPYLGIVHDARYYALQALNAAKNGQFARDIFLEFGSQDNYSIFSYVIGPLTALMGLDVAFWLAYMASSALFIYAAVRFMRNLITDRGLANIAILAAFAMPIFYGGAGSFRIHESFFTARLVAQGFGLLGLSALLQQAPYTAIGCTLASVLFHPIMGICSFLTAAAMLLKDKLRTKLAVCAALLLFLAVVLAVSFFKWDSIRPWVIRDDVWFSMVKHRAFTCFPMKWLFVDWYRMIGAGAIIFGCYKWLAPRSRTLVIIIVWIGIAGLLSSILGDFLSCPILIQGQGWRAFWQIQVIALPLGFLALNRFACGFSVWSSWALMGAFLLLANPFFVSSNSQYLALMVFQAGLFLIFSAFFLFRKTASHRRRILPAALCFLVMAAGLLLLFAGGAIRAAGDYDAGFGSIASSMIKLGSRSCVLLIALYITSVVLAIIKSPKILAVFALTVWFSLNLATYMLKHNPEYKERIRSGYKDVQFIAETLKKHAQTSGVSLKDVQIYWPECSELIWFDLQANSYYSYSQTAGVVFRKETILEGLRRADLVKSFEVALIRQSKLPLKKYELARLAYLKASMHDPSPVKEDLIRLAHDRKLGWIVLNIGFEGLYSYTNKSVYIYDCPMIRRTYALPD